MKHVVLFSGGVASAYVAHMVKNELGKEGLRDIVLLNTPTWSEDRDIYRFMCQVGRKLKLPITIWGDGRTIWQLIQDRGAIPGNFIPFCTQRLKQEMKEQYYKYLERMGEEYIEYVGFGADEPSRVQKAYARAQKHGRKIRFPIAESCISSEEIKKFITEEWKLQLPNAYKALKHNNCIPCFKGGKEYFYQVYKFYPEQFELAKQAENETGYTVFKDTKLEELEKNFMNKEEWENNQYQIADFIPCDCWL
ncbi:hypothetical protein [[Clostridium] polysaccharolyticum]|uniref:Phosphoadenosine phosphosulfate reductase family protein n=1 Tax=[Clostridium] polysaccharolyticum TaxID=29364 RepID=A0A1H9YIR3_9FIRM|nr:hypothetical protein [[Clostridium] polysaccharolyticum]SES68959.1 hypothetical protein SAMN04487772_10241 [[Clostridium] polysaccharolyticum]